MTVNFINYDQDQQHIMPKDLAELVEEDSLERFVSDTIDRTIGEPAGPGANPGTQLKPTVEDLVASGQSQDGLPSGEAEGLALAYSRDWIETADREAIYETVRNTIDNNVVKYAERGRLQYLWPRVVATR